MIINCGTDIVEIERITQSIKDPKFLSRVFSPQELKYFTKIGFNASSIAANFAGKEAFAKSIGTGFRGIYPSDISILRNAVGQPFISLSESAKEIVSKEKYKFSVSLSHSKLYATAVVVAYHE